MTRPFDFDLAPEAAVGENAVQRALRGSLQRIRRVGHQEFASDSPGAALVSMCGFRVASSAPSPAHAEAAILVLRALAEVIGADDDVDGFPYSEAIGSMQILATAIGISDARACALLELLHRATGHFGSIWGSLATDSCVRYEL